MSKARKVKFVLAGAALCAASPALASDFSGLIYIFLALVVVVGLFALGLVFALRSIIKTGGVVVDLTSAALLAGAIAPAGFVDDRVGAILVWFPGWVLLIFEFDWGALLPSYPISLLVVGALVFGVIRLLRVDSTGEPTDPEG